MTSQILVYILLGIASIAYAFLLNTDKGKKLASEYTWASVVIGTGIVLLALWFLISHNSWLQVVISFVVAGSPMIARSLINKTRK
jgi:hypothetical protein